MMTSYRILLNKEWIIATEGVVNQLNTLQPNKASGPDEIPSRFLKEYRTLVLTLIFQASVDQGKLPSDWKYPTIVPAHKLIDVVLLLKVRCHVALPELIIHA